MNITAKIRMGSGLLLLLATVSGCGYTLGPQRAHCVRTVHVEIVQNDSFRRNIDYLLTEAVQREIRNRSAYRLSSENTADTLLSIRLVEMRKDLLSETRFDDARELELSLGVQVSWTDRRNGRVLQDRVFPIEQSLARQATNVSFAPELGHSMATAQQQASERLAARIVDLLEVPW